MRKQFGYFERGGKVDNNIFGSCYFSVIFPTASLRTVWNVCCVNAKYFFTPACGCEENQTGLISDGNELFENVS